MWILAHFFLYTIMTHIGILHNDTFYIFIPMRDDPDAVGPRTLRCPRGILLRQAQGLPPGHAAHASPCPSWLSRGASP